MVIVPSSFREMPRWWTDAAGREWLDRLPHDVGAQCARWSLDEDGPALHGSNALVVPVRRGECRLALRMAPPGDDVDALVEALRVWSGHGTVGLVDVDGEARALLLERLDDSRSLASAPLHEAVEALASLAVRLSVAVPPDVPGTDAIAMHERARFEAARIAPGEPALRAQRDLAVTLAAALAAETPAPLATNGDFHFDQVLTGEEGWTVIDPVLLRGDLEYDLGRILWSRLDEVRDEEHLLQLFDLFVSRTGVPRERARAWVVVRSMSYLLWGIEHGLTQDPPRCRRLLATFA